MSNIRTNARKAIVILLCFLLVFTMIPTIAIPTFANTATDTRVVDNNTMDSWKNVFGSGVNNTENAGGIWTDKSVFSSSIPKEFSDHGIGIDSKKNTNFLVAMSALASNKQIVGYSHIPTDTMLVLDLSASMSSGDVSAMVTATNSAIQTLQNTNKYNRVGVVLYSGNSQTGNSSTSTATVLLPLDRYETDSDNRYIRYNNNSVSVDGDTRSVSNPSKTFNQSKNANGGTYIQNGVYKAWQEFERVTDTSIETGIQAGTKRMPILVLMSDGAPTAATNNFSSVGQSNAGRGLANNSDGMGFLTQLTISWVKEKLEDKYDTTPMVYTLGLGLQNIELSEGRNIARSVLDPDNSTTGIINLWSNYITSNSDHISVEVPSNTQNNGTKSLNVYKNALITNTNQMHYVDEFFSATNAEGLNNAFGAIVQEIIIQSKYYPTMAEEGNQDIDGYISFEDDLGAYMEVKDVKGVVIGDQLFSGAKMATVIGNGQLGTVNSPTALGNEFIGSVKERLGITTQQARDLIAAAYRDGQIGVTTSNGGIKYNNHVSWYADADYNYLGFHSEKGTSATPQNAKYIVTSFGYLGEEAITEDSIEAADMMYMTVRIETELTTGNQSVHWSIPASLIPTVTYKIELEGDSYENAENIKMNIVPANPARLVYEVGLQDRVNELTLADLMAEPGAHKHEDGKGGYYFYSNMWGVGDGEGNIPVEQQNPNTHKTTTVDFEPSINNERYYYAEDTVVYERVGNEYRAVTYDPNTREGIYYHARQVFEKTGTGNAAVIQPKYEVISGQSLSKAIKKGNNYYIPKGTIQREKMGFLSAKDENKTSTLAYVNYPFIYNPTPDTDEDYGVDVFLGNNGRINLTPATGIKLTKAIDVVEPGKSATGFEFEITFDGDMANKSLFCHFFGADGKEIREAAMVTDSNKKMTVTLDNQQTVYITGLPAGVNYTIIEKDHVDYTVSKVTVNDVLEADKTATNATTANKLDKVVFENTLKTHGNLVISKTITHPFGDSYVMPEETKTKKFEVKVQLTGNDVSNKTYTSSSTVNDKMNSVKSDANGVITLQLQHNEIISIQGITTGTEYTVTEPGYTTTNNGYILTTTQADLTGIIPQDLNASVKLVNNYTPTEVPKNGDKEVIVTVEKKVTGREWLNGEKFDFVVEKFDGSNWVTIRTAQATEADKTFNEVIFGNTGESETYTKIGTYQYRVREVIPAQGAGGMTYDATIHYFNIVVADDNMDGTLEIKEVVKGDGTQVTATAGKYNVSVKFDNVYAPTEGTFITVNIQKVMNDLANAGKLPSGFEFGIYANGQLISTSTTTENDGIATLVKNYYPSDLAGAKTKTFNYVLKEIVPAEADKTPGMKYSGQEYNLAVTVEDNLDGTLSANYVLTDKAGLSITNPSFVNTYDLGEVGIQLNAKKTLKDVTDANSPKAKDFNAGKFTFDLYAANEKFGTQGAPLQSVTNAASTNGAADVAFTYFDNLKYKEVGTYRYVVKERIPSTGQGTDGITYDTTEHRVEVIVTEKVVNDKPTGTLQAEVRVDGHLVADTSQPAITFDNTYNAKPVDLAIEGTKILTGRASVAGEFFFTLFETDENFNNATKVQTVSNVTSQSNDKFFFDAITYTADDTHYYVVKETDKDGNALPTTKVNGVTYDQTEYKLRVNVTDTNQGTHQVVVEKLNGTTYEVAVINGDNTQINFNNTYAPANATIDLDNKVIKTLTGRGLAAGEFEFVVLDKSGAEVARGTNAAAGEGEAANVTFNNALTFNQAGTYEYTLREVLGAKGGVTYDEYVYNIVVTVTDNLQGQLTASYVVDGDDINPNKQVSFGNVYTTLPARVTLEATKVLEGRDLAANEFWFDLYDGNGNIIQSHRNAAAKSETVSNVVKASGNVIFDEIIYDEPGVYEYVVKERNEHRKGIIYDNISYEVRVTVNDDLRGNLIPTIEVKPSLDGANYESIQVDSSGEKLVFNNKDLVDASVVFNGTKKIIGRELAENEFQFALYSANMLYDKVNDKPLRTARVKNVNGNTGVFEFEPVVYDTVGTYRYIVEEVVDKNKLDEGVIYDGATFRIKVDVEEVNGHLKASYTIYEHNGILNNQLVSTIQFDNEYVPTPISVPVSTLMTATKTLDGRDLAAGEFKFQIVDENDNVVSTGTNAAADEGKAATVTFDKELKFTKAGTYEFSVVEVNNDLDGVEYDDIEYTLTVKINDDGKGNLSVDENEIKLAEPNATAQTATFKNIYKPEPIEIDFIYNVNKILEGRDIKAGEFEFELYDLNGASEKLLQTKKNDAPKQDGKAGIDFDPVKFEAKGTYKFKIVEKNNGIKAVDYSDAEYIYTVEIADNGKAKLTVESIKCTLDGVEKPAHFTNVYRHTDVEITKTQAVNDGTATKLKVEAKPGDIITYFLTVTNNGNVPAHNLEVADKVPAGLEVVKDSITAGGVLADDGTIKWTLEKLDGQAAEGDASAYVVSFKVKVPEVKQTTTWKNVATVAFDDPSEDPAKPENKTKESNIVEVEVARPLPDTGDHSGVGLWTAIAALAATGFVGLNIKRKEEQ